MKIKIIVAASALTLAGLSPAVRAQTTYTENFTGPATTNSWFFLNGACLTAGTATTTSAANPESVLDKEINLICTREMNSVKCNSN